MCRDALRALEEPLPQGMLGRCEACREGKVQCILGKVGGACWEGAMVTLRGRTEWQAVGPFWNRDGQGAAVFIYLRSEVTLVVSILELLSSGKTAWLVSN